MHSPTKTKPPANDTPSGHRIQLPHLSDVMVAAHDEPACRGTRGEDTAVRHEARAAEQLRELDSEAQQQHVQEQLIVVKQRVLVRRRLLVRQLDLVARGSDGEEHVRVG